MESRHRPSLPAAPRQSRTRIARLLTAATVAALAVTFSPGSASADPASSMDEVRAQVAKLTEREQVVTEQYDQARVELASAEQRTHALHRKALAQQARVERLRRTVGSLAVAAFMGGAGGVSDLATLAAADTPQDFVDKAASLEQIAEQDNVKVARYERASRDLATQRAAAADAIAQQRRITSRLKSSKAAILDTLGKQKRLLAQLEAAEARRLAEERARQAAAAAADQPDRASRGTERSPDPVDLPPASGRAAEAVAFAKAQLGKPYQWAADGPGSYDCSGLTMAAWAAAGVSLPHSSSSQYSSGPHVSRSQLQPGDLVFFYSPISHVGLYVGGGKMIDAPHTGAVVEYQSIDASGPYAGAVRPG